MGFVQLAAPGGDGGLLGKLGVLPLIRHCYPSRSRGTGQKFLLCYLHVQLPAPTSQAEGNPT